MIQRRNQDVSLFLVILSLVFSSFFIFSVHGFDEFLGTEPITIDKDGFTVSGFSTGAFFASQFHVAYSSLISGVGLFSGGPYYCAEGSFSQGNTTCRTGVSLDVMDLVSDAKRFAEDGLVDGLGNLTAAQVYLYSGLNDTVFLQSVTRAVADFYNGANVTEVFDQKTPHCIPTNNGTTPCNSTTPPFLNNCDYDGFGKMLQSLYSQALTPPSIVANFSNFWKFPQTPFEPSNNGGGNSPLLSDYGFYYLPTSCANNSTKCKLHIFFHGEKQAGADFSEFTFSLSLNAWAEANNILVIYPQAATYFDWWGFTNADYALKYGLHIRAVTNILTNMTNIDFGGW